MTRDEPASRRRRHLIGGAVAVALTASVGTAVACVPTEAEARENATVRLVAGDQDVTDAAGRTWRITCNTREINGVLAATRAGIGICVLAQSRVPTDIPEDWLKAVAEKFLTPDEMAAIQSLGSWDEIMETLG